MCLQSHGTFCGISVVHNSNNKIALLQDHFTDCYICLTIVSGFSSENKKLVNCVTLPSAMRSVSLDDSRPVPKALVVRTLDDEPDIYRQHLVNL